MVDRKGRPIFHPTFGSRPTQIVGRDDILNDFLYSLEEPIGSRERCTLLTGQRGMGKTALLQELADLAEQKDFVTASVTCYKQMNEEIVEILQRKGNEIAGAKKRKLQGIEAGALGFSIGFSFSEEAQEQFGFRSKLTMLTDRFAEYNKGILILVDEAISSESMRQLAITYQQLVGENKNIAICMAGLPGAISSVLNDDILTFLNRAKKVKVGPISINSIADYYEEAFDECGIVISDAGILRAAEETKGFPYLMQLIGYYIIKYDGNGLNEKQLIEKAVAASQKDLEENVFDPILRPLSEADMKFLYAMSKDDGTSRISDICKRLDKSSQAIQPYRHRLIEAGVVESLRRGELTFTIPHIEKYLRNRHAQ